MPPWNAVIGFRQDLPTAVSDAFAVDPAVEVELTSPRGIAARRRLARGPDPLAKDHGVAVRRHIPVSRTVATAIFGKSVNFGTT